LDLYEAETPEDGGAQVAVRFVLLRTITSNASRMLVVSILIRPQQADT
jgi:hypothetical protein